MGTSKNVASPDSPPWKFALAVLSRLDVIPDTWKIGLTQSPGALYTAPSSNAVPGKVLLFSGGLDSLAAAVEFSNGAESLALASHITKNRQTVTAQKTLYQMLRDKGCNLSHHSFFVSAKDKGNFEHSIENG